MRESESLIATSFENEENNVLKSKPKLEESKSKAGLGSPLGKAISNLLHQNQKHDHK